MTWMSDMTRTKALNNIVYLSGFYSLLFRTFRPAIHRSKRGKSKHEYLMAQLLLSASTMHCPLTYPLP